MVSDCWSPLLQVSWLLVVVLVLRVDQWVSPRVARGGPVAGGWCLGAVALHRRRQGRGEASIPVYKQ